ncbi:YcgL domain-containing protein [Paraferrimonas sedimenticola]|uniref:YcgL domain-containing protein GCM10007895_18100 n=1 Tax=Paraferrimonas sedimenticola TaxID=375674 RepID=A0AA37VXC9_9GAMM|nr:YcgL domain-containing protein [Paraferrimonas sedimenticola]GLP96504.1 YcgL domain-containing protein [Paraferrimonas sedimenticola]
MKLCAVYKSSRKADTYLYMKTKDDFSCLPDELRKLFGTPLFVMMLPIQKLDKLAIADIEKVRDDLLEKGFYLQLPPPQDNLLKQHLQQQRAENGDQ